MKASPEPKHGLISRRGLLGGLGAGAVAALTVGLRVRADETPQASPNETQNTKSPKPPLDEGLLPAVDEASKLQYVVDVPTKPRARVKLASLDDRFVKPIELTFKRDSDRVGARFLFQGFEDRSRVVRVSIELLDSEGKSIRVLSQDAKDARPVLRETPPDVSGGEAAFMFRPTNEHTFQFETAELKLAKQAIFIIEEVPQAYPNATQDTKNAKPPVDEGLLPAVDEASKLQYIVDIPAERKAEVKLASLDDRFVKPSILTFKRADPARVALYFQFQGPEDPNRIVRVSIELIDSEEKSIRTMTCDEKDARPEHRERRGERISGFVPSTFLPENESLFSFEAPDFELAKKAVITLEEL